MMDTEEKKEYTEDSDAEQPASEHLDESVKEQSSADESSSDKELDEAQLKAVLEGLLYIVGDDGLKSEQAAQALDINEQQVEKLLQMLKEEFDEKSHGIELVDYGGTWRFVSKKFVSPYGRKLFALGKKSHLSQAALETLAIIAYKQPITRVEIEEIRGVGADVMLRKLEARNLIKESGRSDAPGRPILYVVTEEFMNSFSLLSLKELPELPKFSSPDANGEEDLFQQ